MRRVLVNTRKKSRTGRKHQNGLNLWKMQNWFVLIMRMMMSTMLRERLIIGGIIFICFLFSNINIHFFLKKTKFSPTGRERQKLQQIVDKYESKMDEGKTQSVNASNDGDDMDQTMADIQ